MPCYVVGGRGRSGTSMMMKALEAGGIAPACPESLSPITYEIGTRYLRDDCCEVFNGMAFKAPWRSSLKLPAGEYKVVVVTRNPLDVHESTKNRNPSHSAITPEQYKTGIVDIICNLKARDDMHVSVTRYEDVLMDPVSEFQRLVDVGWPIDPVKAASIVDPAQCHYESKAVCNG